MAKLYATITKTFKLFLNVLRRDGLDLEIQRSPDLYLTTVVRDELELHIEVR